MKLFFGPSKQQPVVACTDVRDCLPNDKKYQHQDGFSMAEAAKCWVAASEYLPRSIRLARIIPVATGSRTRIRGR
jgi:hypothetical protein